ncbi:hypothetical protein ACWGBU_28915 [Streptomyces vinaceus]
MLRLLWQEGHGEGHELCKGDHQVTGESTSRSISTLAFAHIWASSTDSIVDDA